MKSQPKRSDQRAEEIGRYLDDIPKFSKDKHTLDTLRRMLILLGDPQKDLKIIHVAGTNGKGSVCSFLASIIRKAGVSAAVFTSPHLLTVKERFVFDGESVEDALFCRAFEAVESRLEEFERQGLGHPSYFEFLFLMFMVMVKERPTDYVVLETGLGGRLDATNVILAPKITVITSISLDHMEYLGDTVEKIAGEKAGIIKSGVPVVYDNTDPEASRVIEEKAREMGVAAWPVDRSSYSGLRLEGGRLRFLGTGFQTGQTGGDGLKSKTEKALELDLPFAAEYQAVNCMLAVRAAKLLGFSDEVVTEGAAKASWPGRMEQIEPDVYLDGAHNEGGIRAFSQAAGRIAAQKRGGRRILLFAVVSDKEYGEMAGILCREFAPDVLILTQIHYSRGLDIKKLEAAAKAAWRQIEPEREHDVRVIETVEQAFLEACREKRPEDTVFCAGSLYLIGEIKNVLRRKNR